MDQQNAQYTVKHVHVFVPVVLCAVTMLIFQMKRITLSEKSFNYVVTFFFLKMPKIWVGRTTLKGEKKRMAYDRISINHDVINVNVSQINDTPLNFLLGQSSQANDVVYQNRLIRSLVH